MQRLVNEKDHVVEDMLEGYVQAKSYIEYGGSEKRVVKYTDIPQGKVGLVSGGGSGHEPAFLGYIGKNMLVFSSPTANAFLDAFREANHENGVACLFGNYAGDNMNVKMAKAMAEDEGIQVRYVTANDDISSSPKETKEKRHGIALSICGKSQVRPLHRGLILMRYAVLQRKRSSIHAVSVSALPHVRYQMSATRILRFRRVPMNLASVIMENPVWISVLWPVQRK